MLKINSIIDYQAICLDFKRKYLSNNLVMAVSVSLKTFFNFRRKEVCQIFCVSFAPFVTRNELCNGNTNKLIWNIDLKIPFNSLTAILLNSSFRKTVLYSKNIQYGYNFYGTDLYVNVCRGVFRTYFHIYSGAFLQKSQENVIADFRLGFK